MEDMRLLEFLVALRPPRHWNIPVLLVLGTLFGLGIGIAHVSRATSYLSDDPKACVNCHIMNPEFASWERGSHARVAVCNDCHVPHDNAVRKYFFKAKDGARHATMFTLRMEPQVIRMHEPGQKVVLENCLRCHGNLFPDADASTLSKGAASAARHGDGRLCWECHRDTPHGRVHSLSSTPHARVPGLASPLPEWMERLPETKP
jgi:cytochrome c nitrite reductase small subunit